MGDLLRQTFVVPFVLLAVFALVFVPLECASGGSPRAPLFTRRRLVELAHWSVGAAMGRGLATVGVLAALVAWAPLVVLVRVQLGAWGLSFGRLPFAVQVPVALVLADFFAYWSHRAQHASRPLWRLHAIHHAPRQLDWLSAARNPPRAEALGRVLGAVPLVPLVALGVDLHVFAVIAPIVGAWAVFLHANVLWGFGPLRWVVSTPLFHRWHHSRAPEARGKNLAALLPLWDLLFGTYHVPVSNGRVVPPTDLGVDDAEVVPEAFVDQMWLPLRRR